MIIWLFLANLSRKFEFHTTIINKTLFIHFKFAVMEKMSTFAVDLEIKEIFQ